MEFIVLLIIVIVVGIIAGFERNKLKRADMMEKYGDKRIVDDIMSEIIWQGQTEEQLIDSIGKPSAKDQHVLKTKTKETWKYHPTGAKSYAQRIILENGIVVGWKQKG